MTARLSGVQQDIELRRARGHRLRLRLTEYCIYRERWDVIPSPCTVSNWKTLGGRDKIRHTTRRDCSEKRRGDRYETESSIVRRAGDCCLWRALVDPGVRATGRTRQRF